MILDNLLLFTGTSNGAAAGITSTANTDSFAQTAATYACSNVIDLGVVSGIPASTGTGGAPSGGGARDIGVGDDPMLKLLARVVVAGVSAGGGTLQLQLQGCVDNGSGGVGSATTMWTSPAYTMAQCAAGFDLANVDVPRVIPGQAIPRFLKLNLIVGTATITAGTLEATIVLDRDDQIVGTTGAMSGYPAGLAIAN